MAKSQEYARHALSEAFPEMTGPDYEDLKKSIQDRGFNPQFPIWEFEGAILDGWHRYKVATELGVPMVVNVFEGSFGDAAEFVVLANADRRSLSPSQKAAAVAEVADLVKTREESLPADIDAPGADNSGKGKKGRPAKRKGGSVKSLAKKAGVSSKTMQRALRVKKANPKKFKEVKEGKASLKSAEKEVAAKEKKIVDGDGKPVPEALEPVFAELEDWKNVAKMARKLAAEIATLATYKSGKALKAAYTRSKMGDEGTEKVFAYKPMQQVIRDLTTMFPPHKPSEDVKRGWVTKAEITEAARAERQARREAEAEAGV